MTATFLFPGLENARVTACPPWQLRSIDLKQSSDLPPLLEPVFIALDAAIEFTPVMNAEELKQGLSQVRP